MPGREDATTTRPETIRPALPADDVRLAELWRETGLLVWYNDPNTDLALWRATESAEVFVAEVEGAIYGSVACGHDGHRGWLYYLAVAPDSRGQGLGRRLTETAETWLAARGVRKVHAMIRASNLSTREFYLHCGYEPNPVGVVQKWLVDRGTPPDLQPAATAAGTLDVTITYLEMSSPPTKPSPPAPAGMRLSLLRAKQPPIHFYRYLYNTVGEPWLWIDRRMISDQELAEAIHDTRVEIYVAYVDGVPAGFAEIDRRDPTAVDLAYFGLMPDFIGRGLGPYLLIWAIRTAWASNPDKVTVNTCTLDHPKALAMYQKAGFQPVGQAQKTIDDPRLGGIISASPAPGSGGA